MDRKADATSAETVLLGSSASLSHLEEEGRFAPGTLLAGRYRIIALLGRGGMGEVYRATDLTLGQSVALKFLPSEAGRDQRLLERFHGEVRIARQVSHPNVCRVYDIGEAEGTPFISMEYVDGEDLASLLTRIGRLPADKALEIARKICAGLAAAHDRGVIHRDLKPHNIMLNKRGEVIIMDFGLAAIAGRLGPAEATSGTPAYMAPEQLKGAEVTARSDIYALGLVLYELFTGKRPFDAKNIRELLELQESTRLSSMTSLSPDIEPAVERVVRRCLDPDPSRRPPGALAVAASLPGGDPLAAALAAGETPSPELVAAAGETEGMALRYSIPCLVFVVICLIAAPFWRKHEDAMMQTPVDLPPQALAAKGREIAASLGYTRRPADFAIRLVNRNPLITYINRLPEPQKRSERFAAEAPIGAIYRESLSPLVADPMGEVTSTNPPPTELGMVRVNVDGFGRLLDFSAIPYDMADQSVQPIAPEAVFRAAGYDLSTFTETAPQRFATVPADQFRAWKGPHPAFFGATITIEVASWRGRVTRVQIAAPWSPTATQTEGESIRQIYSNVLTIALVLFAALFAFRNWKLGRVDRKGALRLALSQFVLSILVWFGAVHAVASREMFDLFKNALADWLFSAALLWVMYLALEPPVRARWPHSIVTWNRLLAGRWLDPQVGSHVLIGAAVGCALVQFFEIVRTFAYHGAMNNTSGLYITQGTRQWIGEFASIAAQAIIVGCAFIFGLFFLRSLLKHDWAAAVLASLLGIWVESGLLSSPDWKIIVATDLVVYFLIFIAMLRFGLLATVAAVFFVNGLQRITLGVDWSTWYAPYGLAAFAFFLAITLAAFWRSLGAQKLLGDPASAV